MKKSDNYLAFGAPDFTDAEIEAVSRVMRSGWIGMGKETIAFERELREYVDVPEVVMVNSCTSALFLSLLVEGVKPGDEVIVPSLTWCSTANSVIYCGAIPIFCDVDVKTMSVSIETILAKVTSRTRAVIVVHFGGYAVDVLALRDILPKNIAIIEDAAHAFGANYLNGKRVGSSGNSVCFSFYANKNLSTGEGGAIALFDTSKANRLRSLCMNGMESNAWSRYIEPSNAFTKELVEIGYKMNFTDLQAAIGRVQLSRFNKMARTRFELVKHYKNRLEKFKVEVSFQTGIFDDNHAHHLLIAQFNLAKFGIHRDELLLELRARNIGASLHYKPLHIQSAYSRYGITELPVTKSLANKIITLPISAKFTIADVDYIVENLVEILN